MVQTCKTRLRNICFTRNKKDWDLAIPYSTMGYKIQTRLFVSLCSILLFFGRYTNPPFSIVAQMDQVVDLDFPATWARVITEKVVLFRRVMPMAMENLSIAQHQDTLRYAHMRWQLQT
jgi:hypothetical protein